MSEKLDPCDWVENPNIPTTAPTEDDSASTSSQILISSSGPETSDCLATDEVDINESSSTDVSSCKRFKLQYDTANSVSAIPKTSDCDLTSSAVDDSKNQSACSLITQSDYSATDRSRDSGYPSNGTSIQLCSTPKTMGHNRSAADLPQNNFAESSNSESFCSSPENSNSAVLSPTSPGPLPITSAYACLMSRAAKNSGYNPASPLVCDDSGYSPPPSPPPSHIADWLSQFNQFPLADKHTALDRLLGTCNFDQLRYMYSMIEPQFQFDIVAKLPRDVALLIFKYLSPVDLCRCSLVCHSWRRLAEDNLIWREKCKESEIKNEQMMNLGHHGPSITPDEFIDRSWKAAYVENYDIERNWQTLTTSASWSVHNNHVITCLHLYQNKVICGSDDCSLTIWDLDYLNNNSQNNYSNNTQGQMTSSSSLVTETCSNGDVISASDVATAASAGIRESGSCSVEPMVLMGHEGGVWSCEVSDGKVVSGSTDRTLKVWDLDTGEIIHTLNGHSSTVRCISVLGSVAVSGSRDATLRMWDLDAGKCLGTLQGHLAAVRCVAFDGKLIISGAYDCHVKVWSFETKRCLHTLEGHSQRVYSLQFDGIYAVSGSLDASIIVWNVHEGKVAHILRGHKSLTSSMVLRNNVLISGNADSKVKIWDIIKGTCTHTLQCGNKHSSAVTGLEFSRHGKYIVSASDDGTVKLWNVVTGQFVRDLLKLQTSGMGGVVWRIRCNETMLVCAVGSRNSSEDTKLVVFDFRSKRKNRSSSSQSLEFHLESSRLSNCSP